MGKWLERKSNWLNNEHNVNSNFQKRRSVGRPTNDSEDYGVKYIPIKCPKCKSKDVICYKTDPPTRYHICRACGWRFKSTEEE